VQELINPVSVEDLVSRGIFQTEKLMTETRERKGGIADLIEQMKIELHDLTPQQIQRMHHFQDEHYRVIFDYKGSHIIVEVGGSL
jgi:hypothetical protein